MPMQVLRTRASKPVKTLTLSPAAKSAVKGDGSRQLNELIYERIKTAIIVCEIAPGSDLSEGLLADLYNVGKAPVRHALLRLAQDGWVSSIPRQGHRVASVTFEEVEEIFEMRELLEPEAVRRAAGQIAPARLRDLHEACAKTAHHPAPRATRELLRAHGDFHVEIARASGNKRLVRALEQLHHESLRIFHLLLSAEGFSAGNWVQGQEALLQALIAGEGEKAAQISLDGIRRSRREIVKVLSRMPGLAAA